MGLDLVEMVMEMEEELGFQFPDEDAEHLITAGQLSDYIAAKVAARAKGESRCRTQHVFYAVRQKLMRDWEVPRREIRPATHVSAIDSKQKINWRQLLAGANWHIRGLRRPDWMGTANKLCWIAFVVVLLCAFKTAFIPIVSSFIAFQVIAVAATFPFAVRLPAGIETLEQLSCEIVKQNQNIPGHFDMPSSFDAWDYTCRKLSAYSRVPPEKILPESTIVKELGIGS